MRNDKENEIRHIADYERISGVFWIVFGIIQIHFFIVGSTTQWVVITIINMLLCGVIGLIRIGFYIRDKVPSNASFFNPILTANSPHQCGSCSKYYEGNIEFCPHCRNRIAASNSPIGAASSDLCFECGKYFEGQTRFCPNCGQTTRFNRI